MISKALNQDFIEIIGYMITSARGLIDEPKSYGPFRLIEGVSRLCEILMKEDGIDREFLQHLKEKIDESKFSVMGDMDTFVAMLDDITLYYTKKLKEPE